MVDVKSGPNPLFLREEDLRQAMEMLFFAYRDFTAEPDQILAAYCFGRAHHRVLYFVGRNPAITVSELLDILGVTKQSLSRVLGQLIRDGFIVRRHSEQDQRKRLLELSNKGKALENALVEKQRLRIAKAYQKAGAEAVEGFRQVLLNIMDDKARKRFDSKPPGS
jgi:DNA-binding MarR family transcriptional regulator